MIDQIVARVEARSLHLKFENMSKNVQLTFFSVIHRNAEIQFVLNCQKHLVCEIFYPLKELTEKGNNVTDFIIYIFQ